jgi:hypothetical protein
MGHLGVEENYISLQIVALPTVQYNDQTFHGHGGSRFVNLRATDSPLDQDRVSPNRKLNEAD